MYQSFIIFILGCDTWVELIILDMVDFLIILGMDWLSPYYIVLDCHAKMITLAMPNFSRLK